MRENMDQKNFVPGIFSRSVSSSNMQSILINNYRKSFNC